MARARVDFDVSAAKRVGDRIRGIGKQVKSGAKTAMASVQRKLKPKAATMLAQQVLNLPAAKISPHLNVTVKEIGDRPTLILSANKQRLPLTDYNGAVFGTNGMSVMTWREDGVRNYPHVFERDDARGGWQRIPENRFGLLVARLPIVARKGPSIHRAFLRNDGRRGGRQDISPQLGKFVQSELSAEIARLLRAGFKD